MAFKWPLSQQYSVFLVGKEADIYAKHGIDVSFLEGTGSANTSQLIASNQVPYAAAVDAGSAMRAISQGANIKIIGETLPSVTIAVLSKGSKCINTPQDMVGKTIAVPPGTTQSQMFPALLKINNIDEGSLNVVSVDASALVAGLMSDQFDGYVSYTVSNVPILTGQGADPCAMLFSDYGVALSPGETMITNADTIANDADLTQRMVSAVQETLDYAVDHPDEDCQAAVGMFPDQMTNDVCMQATGLVIDQIKAVKAADSKPFMCINDDQINKTLDLLENYADFQGRLPASNYYTNQFISGC